MYHQKVVGRILQRIAFVAIFTLSQSPLAYVQDAPDSLPRIGTDKTTVPMTTVSFEFESDQEQGPLEAPQNRNSRTGQSERLPGEVLNIHWLKDGSQFWYSLENSSGDIEFWHVNTVRGDRQTAFDHAQVRNALESLQRSPAEIESLEFNLENELDSIAIAGKWYAWDKAVGSLTEVADRQVPTREESRRRRGRRRSSDPPVQRTKSPDELWEVIERDSNLYLKGKGEDEPKAITTDGTEDQPYQFSRWSPDSKFVVVFRLTVVTRLPVHLVQSSPPEGGRAKLTSRPYSLPGDPFPRFEINAYEVETGRLIAPNVEPFEHEWERPRVRFSPNFESLRYEQVDRGHQRLRVIDIELKSGNVRNIIDEQSDTFIWTAHTEELNLERINWLDKSDEILYVTEKNGWRQIVLVDARTGEEKRELTPRHLVVRGIERIDEDERRVYFAASGRPNQDPYFVHFGWVDMDSGQLTWMTEGDGNHSIEFAPDGKSIIDRYSRVDMGPVHELRRVQDGGLLCSLASTDLAVLRASGWREPEVFVAKGRDDSTDIWGLIYRPNDFDSSKRYPVIEDIYAGPQGSFVPKNFSRWNPYSELNRLGFIVVKIDGMGTANRSKAFHDVCYKNLKDAGFEDRIRWIKEAGALYPEMDLERVGIYGVSAGGQNAAAAVLFHPEFYRVAVAACGCHDNRMDKSSWNEQWMGYPVGPAYSECSNIDNAHRLGGKLLLIVGEMDDNVPPESTLRFVDALIRAEKDFDMLVVPNAGHGLGGTYGTKRMQQFFAEHLKPQQ